jgi:mitochondrial chaperone BCS1
MAPSEGTDDDASSGGIAALFPANVGTYVHNLSEHGNIFGIPTVLLSKITPFVLKMCRKYPKTTRIVGVLLAATLPLQIITTRLRSMLAYLLPFISTTFTLDTNDPLAKLLVPWLRKQTTIWPKRPIALCTSLDKLRNIGDSRGYQQKPGGAGFVLDPTVDYRLFWYKGVLFSHTYEREAQQGTPDHTLRCFTRSAEPLTDLIEAVLRTKVPVVVEEEIRYTSMRVPDHTDLDWNLLSEKPARGLESVQLDQGIKETIINDVARFLHDKTKAKYNARCIPHRRGYLFHGPPGNGKSSLAAAIAGHFSLEIFSLSLTDPELTDGSLARLVANTEDERALILIEDIDAAGIGRETTAIKMQNQKSTVPNEGKNADASSKKPKRTVRTSKVTLSGLLNAIDGATAPEGHILVMSSNCPEDLDKALTRPGRVDVWLEFKNASAEQLLGMFMRFFTEDGEEDWKSTDAAAAASAPAANTEAKEPELAIGLSSFPIDQKHGLSQPQLEELAEQFVKIVPEYVMSVAQVQEYFIPRFGDPKSAVKGATEWVKTVLEQEAAVPAEGLAGETRQGTPTPSLVDEERKEWADGADSATDED